MVQVVICNFDCLFEGNLPQNIFIHKTGHIGHKNSLNIGGHTAAVQCSDCWDILQREGEQSANYLNMEPTGALATGSAKEEQSGPGQSCRQELT